MTAPTTPASRLTARTPEDVLAVVPVLLGFVPTDSIAMLTFGPGRPFHARVDLPGDAEALGEVVDLLLEPAGQHDVRRVLFVLYTDDATLAARAGRRLESACADRGIAVVEMLRADGERWWPAVGRRPGVPPAGVPYDLTTHPFSAGAVLDGRVLHGSREELRATVAAVPDLVGPVLAALADLGKTHPTESWTAGVVARHSRAGTTATDAELGLLLRGLLDPEATVTAVFAIDRSTAPAQVAFWSDVVRRSPDPLVPGPAAVLAFAAWQAGHGALAWCALDRCSAVDDDHPLAAVVAAALERALPPEAWSGAGGGSAVC